MRTTALLLAVILLGITAAARHRRVPDLLGRLLRRPAKGTEHFARAAAWTPAGEAARDLGSGPAGRARLGLEVIAGTHGGTAFATLTDVPALVLGRPGSGKSSAIFIPAVLEWAGSAVVTSTSRDILLRTISHRAQLGPVVVFGPAMRLSEDLQGLLRPWTPLMGCLDRTGQPSWSATWRTAHTVVSAAQDHAPGDGQFWSMKAAELLALAMWTVAVEDAASRAITSTGGPSRDHARGPEAGRRTPKRRGRGRAARPGPGHRPRPGRARRRGRPRPAAADPRRHGRHRDGLPGRLPDHRGRRRPDGAVPASRRSCSPTG